MVVLTPVEDWQLESCVIAETYKKKMLQFTFFPSGKKHISISFSWAEAFAINNFYSANSDVYNVLIRQFLESKLPRVKCEIKDSFM